LRVDCANDVVQNRLIGEEILPEALTWNVFHGIIESAQPRWPCWQPA
jgi:hypothetical protein